jgi:hypothetical protein
MKDKLWYDDIRRPPDDTWDWARTNEEAMELLDRKRYQEVSLDHDMGLHLHDPDEEDADLRIAHDRWDYEDGTDLAHWMSEQGLIPPRISIHSFNPIGAKKMAEILLAAANFFEVPCMITIKPFDPEIRKKS